MCAGFSFQWESLRFNVYATSSPLPLSLRAYTFARSLGRWEVAFVYQAIGSKMQEPLLGTKGRAPFQKIFFFFFISKPPLPPYFLVAWRKRSLFSRVASIAKNIFEDKIFKVSSPRLPKMCSRIVSGRVYASLQPEA